MPISAICPVCSVSLTLADDRAGTMIACPNCEEKFPVVKPKTASQGKQTARFISSTCESIPGYEVVEVLGVVQGVAVWKTSTQKSLFNSWEDAARFTAEQHAIATGEAEREAERIGANAVVGLRYETIRGLEVSFGSLVSKSSRAIMSTVASGTAVFIERAPSAKRPQSIATVAVPVAKVAPG